MAIASQFSVHEFFRSKANISAYMHARTAAALAAHGVRVDGYQLLHIGSAEMYEAALVHSALTRLQASARILLARL